MLLQIIDHLTRRLLCDVQKLGNLVPGRTVWGDPLERKGMCRSRISIAKLGETCMQIVNDRA